MIIKIPESTARYYRDRHFEFLPNIKSGRKRQYKKQALEASRLITELANRNLTAEEINDQLSKKFNRNYEVEETTTITTEQQQKLIEALTANLGEISDQEKEI